MTWYVVNNLSTSDIQSESGIEDHSVGNNTGNAITIASLTKTDTEWDSTLAHELVADNKFSITSTARNYLQTNYADKKVNLDGIFLTLTNV